MSNVKHVNIICDIPAQNMPVWAYLERTLISTMNNAIDIVLQKYLKPNGEFLWPFEGPEESRGVGSLDDVYESFELCLYPKSMLKMARLLNIVYTMTT